MLQEVTPDGFQYCLIRIPAIIPKPKLMIDPAGGRENPESVVGINEIPRSHYIKLVIAGRGVRIQILQRGVFVHITRVTRQMGRVLNYVITQAAA